MQSLLASILFVFSSALMPYAAFAYNSKAEVRAASLVLAACAYSGMGKMPKSNIMSFAKQQYSKKYGNPANVDWNNAITIAEDMDKQQGVGCFK